MKIMATFDGTPYAEQTLPVLAELASLPDVAFTLVAIAQEPEAHARVRGEPRTFSAGQIYGGAAQRFQTPEVTYAESKDQAVQRSRDELEDYLLGLASRLPAGSRVAVEAHVSDDAAGLIVERAREERPNMIVMASHSREGLPRVFLGSTAEKVVRSGVAPVLIVHPAGAK